MSARDLSAKLDRRLRKAGLRPPPRAREQLLGYLELLARWNRRINLTAFDLDKPSDEAVDRLIVEPVAAAEHVLRSDLLAIDVGSGGGSPGLPLALAVAHLRMVLVEVKTKKAAFLREAARTLGLDRIEVENCRVEELLARVELNEAADVVTLRAVRADAALWRTIESLVRPGGRVFWFTSGKAPDPVGPFAVVHRHRLPADGLLVIAERRRNSF